MPYKNMADRNYKREYQEQKKRNEEPDRAERQRARRAYDKKGIDRTGKDIAHYKALSKGGSNKDGTRLESVHANRSYDRTPTHALKSAYDSHFRKRK